MPEPLRVLILEDRPSDARLVVNELRERGFEPSWERVDTEHDFLDRLESAWDLILADYCLPQFDALRALRLLQERHIDVPLVIVSGSIGEETAVAAMKEGATDYLLKDRLGRLGQAVSHALEQKRMREKHRRAKETLEERSQLIMLTADVGLALNRSNSLRDMLQECAQALVKNLNSAFARVWTLSADHTVLELQASAGLYTHLDGPHSRVPVGAFKIGLIAQERAPHLTNDVLNDPRVSDREWARREGMVAFAGYPLIVEGRLVGVMAMFARHQLTQTTLDAMATVANQISAGIERKRAEERLQFTQFTIDHLATPVFWSDEQGRFFNVNDAACRLTGHSRDELLSLHVSDLDPTIPRQGWSAVWDELQQRVVMAFESTLRLKGGTEIPIRINSNLLQAEGRQFSCTIVQDIREQKQAEQDQRRLASERNELLRRLQLQIARMPLAYVLFDADLRVIDWNPAAERIFGYRRDEVLGMGPPFEKILPVAGREHADEILARLKSGDMSAHSVSENLTKDGHTITCEWINTPLEENGQFNGLVCLAQDVTERKRLEDQYRQAQKMEAVGKLAGGVAHDFNNMLTIILGYADMLKESLRGGDPLLELVEQISEAGNRAAGLTRQLLAFSRKQVLTPVSVNLNVLLGDMQKMLGRLIGEDVELTIRPADDLWRVRVDAGQMEQVIMNLAVNSRDAMPKGGKLTIETANVELDEHYVASHSEARVGEHILLAVSDTGCGIDSANLPRIFEPFFSTKGNLGTGLGLATVYGIVKQSGGHVSVYSETGIGTTFKIYLPRSEEHVEAPKPTTPDKDHWRGTETVLLVEDEDAVRSLARTALRHNGYHVIEARHGGEALLLCEKHEGQIHLLATDVVMPQMSGRELADRLHALRPDMKVLYMSGYMDDAIVRHGLIDDGVPFLQKPYTPDALAQKVREALDRLVPSQLPDSAPVGCQDPVW